MYMYIHNIRISYTYSIHTCIPTYIHSQDTLFGGKPRKTDYSDVPTAVFSQPEIGTVGLTEADARKKYKNVHVYRSTFRGMKHTGVSTRLFPSFSPPQG